MATNNDVNWMEIGTEDFHQLSPRNLLDLIFDVREFEKDWDDGVRKYRQYINLVHAEIFLCMAAQEQGLDHKPFRDGIKLMATELQEQGLMEPVGDVDYYLTDEILEPAWALRKIQIRAAFDDCLERLETTYRLVESRECESIPNGVELDADQSISPGGPAKEVRAHSQTPSGTLDDESTLSPKNLAEIFDVPLEALRKRLERLRRKDHNCFIEIADRTSREPQFHYYLGKVRHVIEDMKGKAASSETSSKRPAKKKSR